MASDVRVELFAELDHDDLHAVLDLIDSARQVDASPALSEHALLHLTHHHASADHHHSTTAFIARDGSQVVGFAHLDLSESDQPPVGELVVAPGRRREHIGAALLDSLLIHSPAGIRLWAHGGHSGAAALAAQHGFTNTRELWQMRRSLASALPALVWPPGVAVRTFLRGSDEGAWLALNARCFAHHPEQGAWTARDLAMRMAEPWFDPGGFFLVEKDRQLIGFHWTKIHAELPRTGEVYVVGVDPAAQGGGLGKALTLIGLQHLQAKGLAEVLLYVDGDNAAAIAVYERLGFTRRHTDICFTR